MGGCGCNIYCKASLMILASFDFRNSAQSSNSAANAVDNLSIWYRVNTAPLRCIGCLPCGFHQRKKCPDAWILASLSDK